MISFFIEVLVVLSVTVTGYDLLSKRLPVQGFRGIVRMIFIAAFVIILIIMFFIDIVTASVGGALAALFIFVLKGGHREKMVN